MRNTKKTYVMPTAEQICMAEEDVFTLSTSAVVATFNDGAQVGFGDFL